MQMATASAISSVRRTKFIWFLKDIEENKNRTQTGYFD